MGVINIKYSRTGTGKSNICMDMIEEVKKRGEKAYMIVPEQFSYEAEKRLVERVGGTGINGVEAFTLPRFLRMLMSEKCDLKRRISEMASEGEALNSVDEIGTLINLAAAPENALRIDASGKQMLVYKAVQELDDDGFFKNVLSNNGFLDIVADMIGELKRCAVSDAALEEAVESMKKNGNTGNDLLIKKTEAVREIYKKYNNYISENKFLDSDDDMLRLAAYIYAGGSLSDVHIFVDEFYSFTKYHYIVLQALAERAASVTLFLCADDTAVKEGDTENIFSPCVKIINNLKSMCTGGGRLAVRAEHLPEMPYRFRNSKELEFLERTFDKPVQSGKEYADDVNDIRLFTARDIFSEVEQAALEIIKAVKNGYRYRDIGILCGDLENYSDIIETILKKYNIPYFIDMKKSAASHPIIMTITSVFDIISQDWSYDAVFSYIKTGFAPISDTEADELENFVLEHRIRGEKKWCGDDWEYNHYGVFDAAYEEDEQKRDYTKMEEHINGIRKKVIAPFVNFRKNIKGKRTVRELCTEFYNMLADRDGGMNMPNKIRAMASAFRSQSRNDEYEQFLKIWNILISLMDQAVNVMGDDECDLKRFGEIITAGLSKYEIGIIPSSADRVSVGTIDRSRSINIKEMIIIGASSANIPKPADNSSVFSESERQEIEKNGVELEKKLQDKMFGDQFKIYKALTSSQKKLYISWSAVDWEGNEMRPAEFINDIKRRFPKIKTENNFSGTGIEEYLDAPAEAVFSHILSGRILGEDLRYKKVIEQWYDGREEFKNRIAAAGRVIRDIEENKKRGRYISKRTAGELYGNTEYSISRLNTFARCPYCYFLRYGLRAKPQKRWRVENYDMGMFIHYYLDKFCGIIKERNLSLQECSDEECAEIIYELIKDARERITEKGTNGRVNYMISMIQRSLTNTVIDIRNNLNAGEFSIMDTESEFRDFFIEGKDGNKIPIAGIIDRIDWCRDGDDVYIRIIDYKTGSKEFNLEDIVNNVEFQLCIYAQAAEELYKSKYGGNKSNMAGILYHPMKQKSGKVNDYTRKSDIEKNLIKIKKLDGIIIDNPEDIKVTKKMDKNIEHKDRSRQAESDYFNVGFKKKESGNDDNADKATERSKIVDRKEFDKICGYVNKGVEDIAGRIEKGYIGIYPYDAKEAGSVCGFCDYNDICMFDAENDDYRKKIKLNKSGSGFREQVKSFIEEAEKNNAGKENSAGKEDKDNGKIKLSKPDMDLKGSEGENNDGKDDR